jgi:arsenite methyltransferase
VKQPAWPRGPPRLVTSRPIAITHEAVKQKLGSAKFFSATYRLFKLDGLETACAVI